MFWEYNCLSFFSPQLLSIKQRTNENDIRIQKVPDITYKTLDKTAALQKTEMFLPFAAWKAIENIAPLM